MQTFTDYRMEINCSFQRLVGDTAPKIGEVELQKKVPLRSCEKDISAHKLAVGVNDVESEVDIILARASTSLYLQ